MALNRTRLALLMLSLGLLAWGLAASSATVAWVGTAGYAGSGAVGLFQVVRVARAFRAGGDVEELKKAGATRAETWLNGVLFIGGLFAWLVGSLAKAPIASTVGLTVWGIGLAVGVLAGIVASEILGLPMRFGYGGWEIRHRTGTHER